MNGIVELIPSVYAGASLALLAVMGSTLVRAILGPTAFDRVMAVNMFGTKTVLLLSLLGFLSGRPDFLDIALVYALVNFLSTIAVLRFFEGRPQSVQQCSDPDVDHGDSHDVDSDASTPATVTEE
ncbi:MAG: monovalent cation/H+ antiporter complex subunit F [Desulfuromonadaceae bacterium]|nr:monovalent cation/H+ antiporter complex subunit F [Desulfuromonadaceae bacterium]